MISQENINKIIEKSTKYLAKKVILFGSALVDFENSNDLDIACEMPGLNMFLFAEELENTFNKPIDIIPISEDDPFMVIVNKYGNIIYES